MSDSTIQKKLEALVEIQARRIAPGARRTVDKYALLIAALRMVEESCDVREDLGFHAPILPDVEAVFKYALKRYFLKEGLS